MGYVKKNRCPRCGAKKVVVSKLCKTCRDFFAGEDLSADEEWERLFPQSYIEAECAKIRSRNAVEMARSTGSNTSVVVGAIRVFHDTRRRP
jgi:homoserine kinase